MFWLRLHIRLLFYDNSILSGTKITTHNKSIEHMFYDNSILSGTKIVLFCIGL